MEALDTLDFMHTFLLLLSGGKPKPEDEAAYLRSWCVWLEELGTEGHFENGEPLEGGGIVLQGSGASPVSFSPRHNEVSGFLIIKARSLQEAGDIASRAPILSYGGTVEVRKTIPSW